MFKAFFFDMDGTLLDTEVLWVEAVELLAADHGYSVSRTEALDMVYGIAWPEVYEKFRARFPELAWSMAEMGAMLAPYFLQLRASRDVRVKGTIALLERLAETHPVAVVSGSYKADVEAGIEIAGVADKISFYLGHEDYAPGKPHPACYALAAQRAGALPAECIVFEDSTAGVCAAKDAGARCVALARPGRPAQDLSRADLVFEDLSLFRAEMLACQ